MLGSPVFGFRSSVFINTPVGLHLTEEENALFSSFAAGLPFRGDTGDSRLMWALVCLVPGNPPWLSMRAGKGGEVNSIAGVGVKILDLVSSADGSPLSIKLS